LLGVKKKFPKTPSTAEPRRPGQGVRDARRSAEQARHSSPPKRLPLALEDASAPARYAKVRGGLEVQFIHLEEGCDPYHRPFSPQRPRRASPQRDLHKLSEWIKMMREREKKKRRGED
jgi:hypothetical protein